MQFQSITTSPNAQEWLREALTIAGGYETSGDPWVAVTGNFDGMGISCGVLQWNIGMGTLQPLVKSAGRDLVAQYMPQYGNVFWNACNSTIPRGLQIVRGWQNKNQVRSVVQAELRAFLACSTMRQQQIDRARNLGDRAMELAVRWARDVRNGTPTLREYCWFFDLLVMNGGMKGIWLEDADAFIDLNAGDAAGIICDWLARLNSSYYGWNDCRKNAGLWRGSVADLRLFVLGYLRAQKSRVEFRGIVVNRRCTVAMTYGYVNGDKEDYPQLRAE